jgi:hypothetical protein
MLYTPSFPEDLADLTGVVNPPQADRSALNLSLIEGFERIFNHIFF